jgi:hypothetical protein
MENEQDSPSHRLTLDQAEAFAGAFTRKQMAAAMATFDVIRPAYSDIRGAFVEAVRLQLIAIVKELKTSPGGARYSRPVRFAIWVLFPLIFWAMRPG